MTDIWRIGLESRDGVVSCDINVVRNVEYAWDTAGKEAVEKRTGAEYEVAKIKVLVGSEAWRELRFAAERCETFLDRLRPTLRWRVVMDRYPGPHQERRDLVDVFTLECVLG